MGQNTDVRNSFGCGCLQALQKHDGWEESMGGGAGGAPMPCIWNVCASFLFFAEPEFTPPIGAPPTLSRARGTWPPEVVVGEVR